MIKLALSLSNGEFSDAKCTKFLDTQLQLDTSMISYLRWGPNGRLGSLPHVEPTMCTRSKGKWIIRSWVFGLVGLLDVGCVLRDRRRRKTWHRPERQRQILWARAQITLTSLTSIVLISIHNVDNIDLKYRISWLQMNFSTVPAKEPVRTDSGSFPPRDRSSLRDSSYLDIRDIHGHGPNNIGEDMGNVQSDVRKTRRPSGCSEAREVPTENSSQIKTRHKPVFPTAFSPEFAPPSVTTGSPVEKRMQYASKTWRNSLQNLKEESRDVNQPDGETTSPSQEDNGPRAGTHQRRFLTMYRKTFLENFKFTLITKLELEQIPNETETQTDQERQVGSFLWPEKIKKKTFKVLIYRKYLIWNRRGGYCSPRAPYPRSRAPTPQYIPYRHYAPNLLPRARSVNDSYPIALGHDGQRLMRIFQTVSGNTYQKLISVVSDTTYWAISHNRRGKWITVICDIF
ncbi:unnamed protein product [Nesidiocoris tenuis]|uniref:Uncharacterized protein n=1 Tax=Nesidiocoris tenuis TaxID=355587 RepID=A0A6H5H8J2_9HEMI|nr:unnamed protein product [Nesidiocoris tenuis]